MASLVPVFLRICNFDGDFFAFLGFLSLPTTRSSSRLYNNISIIYNDIRSNNVYKSYLPFLNHSRFARNLPTHRPRSTCHACRTPPQSLFYGKLEKVGITGSSRVCVKKRKAKISLTEGIWIYTYL